MDVKEKKLTSIKNIIVRGKYLLTAEITEKNKKHILGYFFVISLLEILAYLKGGIFSIIASRIWLMTAMILLLFLCIYTIYKLYDDFKNRKFILSIGFCSIVIFLFYFIGNIEYGDINADAAQQIGAGVASFDVADWNYTGLAFLGYANRQYVLGALPALLFGRSVFSLHLGFAGLFIAGLLMMYFEFRFWLVDNGLEEKLALVPCYAIMAFRFIAEYYLNYEQAITPVALTMMGIALFMRIYRKADIFTVIALTWVGCFYCDSYTPVIASLGLLIGFMLLNIANIYLKNASIIASLKSSQMCKDIFAKMEVLGGSALTMGCFFASTLIGKREDRLTSIRENIELVPFTIKTWSEFFSDENAEFFGIFLGIVVFYLFLAICFRLKVYDFVIAVWVLGVAVFSNLLVGYTTYEKAWILQRNMIVIPVLVTAVFWCIMRFFKNNSIQINNKCFVVLLLFLGLISMNNFSKEHQSFNYFRYIQPVKYMISCSEELLDENNISNEDDFNIILITDSVLQANIYDYAKFFYPNAYTCSITSDGNIPDIDWEKRTFIFSENESTLIRFGIDAKSKTYRNVRYNTETTWYYGEVE